MSPACIYDIFQSMGILMKYGGFVPLTGIYEAKNAPKFIIYFINRILSTITLLLQGTSLVIINFFSTSDYIPKDNLFYFIENISEMLFGLIMLVTPIIFYFRIGKQLSKYLKLHEDIDSLLQPQKRRLKYFVNFSLFVLVIIYTGARFNLALQRYYIEYYYNIGGGNNHEFWLNSLYVLSAIDLIAGVNMGCQPQLMYVIFQRVLKSAMDELTRQIRAEKYKIVGAEEAKNRIAHFRKMHLRLCELCKLLDEMVSPLMLFNFTFSVILIVDSASYICLPTNLKHLASWFFIGEFVVAILFPMLYAEFTLISASKILPAVFHSFHVFDKNIKLELDAFSLQEFCLKHTFSASGLFELNGELIVTIFQSIVSYYAIFIKLRPKHGFGGPPQSHT